MEIIRSKRTADFLRRLISAVAVVILGYGPVLNAQGLRLPSVPDTLREPADRAAFIINHFWDSLDFVNTSEASDIDFLEQPFADFTNIALIADTASRVRAINTLLDRAVDNPASFTAINRLAEKYLYSPDSPVFSDDTYAIFLRYAVNSDKLSQTDKIRPALMLDGIMKNRAGTPASDFTFETSDGNSATLYDMPDNSPLLLIFYDPDCSHCSETIEKLRTDSLVGTNIRQGKLNVLAVYSGDDRDFWLTRLPAMPVDWTVGYEDGSLQDDGTYIIRTMPTIFLLDSKKNVILKEPTVEKLIETLQGMTTQP